MSNDAVAPTAYTAEVDREDGWWTIHVVDLDVVTQASRWSEVEDMARGVVIAMLDLDEDAAVELEIVPVFDDEAGRLFQAAEDWEAEARELVASAFDAKRAAVRTLKQAGWTLQAIAAGIGLSYQRVEQLLKEAANPATSSTSPVPVSATPPAGHGSGGQPAATKPKETATSTRSTQTGRYSNAAAAARAPRSSVRAASGSSRSAHRSAVTGRYVTKSTAKRNPGGGTNKAE